MTHSQADVFKNPCECRRCKDSWQFRGVSNGSGVCLSSLVAVISFLHVLAFSFWSASAGHLLGLGWRHRNTHSVPREESNIPRTNVHAGTGLGAMGKPVPLWCFLGIAACDGGVTHQRLTSEVRARSRRLWL